MELERLESISQQQMIRSIFRQTTYKGEWNLNYIDDEILDLGKKFTIGTTYEVLNKQTIAEVNLPFTLETNEKFYIKDIDKTVKIVDVIKSSGNIILYEIEPKYIDDKKMTREEAIKEFSVLELNIVNHKYRELFNKYSDLEIEKRRWKESTKDLLTKQLGEQWKNISLYKRIFKWKETVKKLEDCHL